MLRTTTETVVGREQAAAKCGAVGRGPTARTRASRWGWVAVAIACVAVWGASAQAAQAAPKLVSDWIGGDLVGAAPPVEGNGGLLSGPTGVAVNVNGSGGAGAGDVYVVDRDHDRIQQFTADGGFIRAWGFDVIVDGDPPPPNSNGTGFEICDVTAATPNVPTDCKAGVSTDGGGGAPGGSLALAGDVGIAVNQVSGDVYASDSGNQRVQRFSATGEFISAWGKDVVVNDSPAPPNSNGTGFEICDVTAAMPNSAADCKAGESGGLAGELSAPRGVAVVPAGAPNAGNVLVIDRDNRRVQEFAADGEFVRTWGKDVIANDSPAPPNSNGTDFEVCDTGHPDSPNGPADCKEGVNAAAGEAGFPTFAPSAVAADASGAVYTVDTRSFQSQKVRKFEPVGSPGVDGATLTHEFFASGLGVLDGSGNAGAQWVAIGPAGNVLVAKGGFDAPTGGGCGAVPSQCELRVLELDPDGTLVIDEHMAGSGINWHDGLAANPDTGRIYVASRDLGSDSGVGSETEAHRVYILDDVDPPTAEMDPVDPVVDVAPFRATFQGLVGAGTRYRFEYKLASDPDEEDSWTPVPSSDADAEAGGGTVEVIHTALGLSPATDYDVRLVARRAFTTLVETSAAVPFETLDAPPTIRGVDAVAGPTSVRLSGRVVPNGSPTTYRFEYGLAPCSESPCTAVPDPDGPDALDGEIGDGSTVVDVAETVTGLDPLTTYHYRLVAGNDAAEETVGADRMFSTGEPPAPAGRAYELVTPFDGGGADTYGAGLGMVSGSRDPWLFNAAPDGERVSFTALPELPGSNPPRSERRTVYRAQRRADLGRWTQAQMSPPGRLVHRAFGGGAAEDLSVFHFGAWEGPEGRLHPDDPGPARDSYLREPDGGWTWVSRNSLLPEQDGSYAVTTLALSRDGRTAVFQSPLPLEPEADGQDDALYTQHPDGTRAEVVSIVDDETGPDSGTVVVAGSPLVSEDGQRILFRTGGSGMQRWWIRLRDEDRTVEVTAPSAGGSRSDAAADVLGMARDASAVVFETAQPLTGDDLDSEVDLFRFDLDGGELERLSAASSLAPSDGQGEGGHCGTSSYGVSGCTVSGVIASEDGSTAYFLSPEQLDVGARPGEPNLYVNRAGQTRLVATLEGGTGEGSDAGPHESAGSGNPDRLTLRHSAALARPVRVTPDGDRLVFYSHARLTAHDNGGVAEVYVFDADAGAIRCASCGSVGAGTENRPAAFETQVNYLFGLLPLGDAPGRNLTADGRRVYFDTEERLVVRDRNGARDVYEYDVDADRVSLISTGQHSEDSYYYDNSADGRDVFFVTRERLVARDLNGGAMRIYDAREGGGFPQPAEPAPCGAGSCRDAPASAPAFEAPDSSDGGGAGNVAPARPARRLAVGRPGRRALRRAARSGRLAVRVRSNRAGRVRVRAVGRIGGRVRPVARARVRLRSAGRARVVLRLPRPARRVLRARGRLRVRLVVAAPGAKPRRVGFVLRRAAR